MIQCKIFSSSNHFNRFIKENNIDEDQIKDIKYIPTIGVNHQPEHNIFLLYNDAPTVMFDQELFNDIQQDLHKYINYTGTPS